ncbi:MAG: biotin--[acetyl-CoA-carboxylase] ligase [Ruminococcaceae bacterium]|nr:biotin--[acetyl-CoA-carboxylase] ligase [Oscillospiraceae bacterium]
MIVYFESLPSTNAFLKEEAKKGAPNYYTVIADRQTSGRGRMGRSFYSDNGGLYMSFLIRNVDDVDVTRITAAAGVSVAEAIKKIYSVSCGIKWVNDLIYNGKKVCGILAEGVISDNGKIEGVVVGIGVNIAPPIDGFNDEIKEIAGAISDHYSDAERNDLAKAILEYFDINITYPDLIDKYRALSTVIGKDVRVITPNGSYDARAIGIDDEFGLTVITDDQKEKTLRSGEISIRTK